MGIFTNHADATISGDAIVNAGKAISVNASTVNQIDPLKLWGANLVSPFLDKNIKAKYNSDTSASPTLKAGDTVEVGDTNPNTDQRGKVYKYVGLDGASSTLATENFGNTQKWEEINLVTTALKTEVGQLTGYLNGNLGLSSKLADFWNQAFADGPSKAAIAGAVTVAVMDHTANAIIQDGASVNQDTAFRSATNQTVAVNAVNTINSINLGGNVQTLGSTSSASRRRPTRAPGRRTLNTIRSAPAAKGRAPSAPP